MRLFGRPRCTISEGEGVESELSGSDDSDNVGSDDGHTSGVQSSVGGPGAFTAGVIMEENSDDEGW
jgi:hypothetical protein